MFCTEWLPGLACSSLIVYECRPDIQVFYALPVESILGKLPVVPVGDHLRNRHTTMTYNDLQ